MISGFHQSVAYILPISFIFFYSRGRAKRAQFSSLRFDPRFPIVCLPAFVVSPLPARPLQPPALAFISSLPGHPDSIRTMLSTLVLALLPILSQAQDYGYGAPVVVAPSSTSTSMAVMATMAPVAPAPVAAAPASAGVHSVTVGQSIYFISFLLLLMHPRRVRSEGVS